MQDRFLYDDFDGLLRRLRELIKSPTQEAEELHSHVTRYDWGNLVEQYDDRFEQMS